MGWPLGSLMTMSGHRKSFQVAKIVNIETTVSAGSELGSTMRVKICHELAPSILAASINSLGSVSKKLLRMMMLNAFAASGSQIAHHVFTSVMWKMGRLMTVKYCGMRYASTGTIRVLRKKNSSTLLKMGFNFESANAAVADTINW